MPLSLLILKLKLVNMTSRLWDYSPELRLDEKMHKFNQTHLIKDFNLRFFSCVFQKVLRLPFLPNCVCNVNMPISTLRGRTYLDLKSSAL